MKPVNLLVVDDEQGIRDLFLEAFRESSTDCRATGDAQEALEIVKQGQADVVLLDIELPGMGGLQLLRRIKEIQPAVIVIIITGHGTVKRAAQAMGLGAHEYVMKPFQIKDVQCLIARFLKMHQLEQKVAALREKTEKKSGSEGDES